MVAIGADDDGSGSVNILEAYRALIAAGFQPERTVEFHWYSGEVCRTRFLPRSATAADILGFS